MAQFRKSENEIIVLRHNLAKVYPNKIKLYMYEEPIPVHEGGWELLDYVASAKPKEQKSPTFWEDSLRRSKTKISDIVQCNDFDSFLTFTFKTNRYNVESCKTRLSKWIENQKNIHGDFSYLLVPEFHKDGKAIHFHGLFSGYKGKVISSGHKQRGRLIYNVKSYRLGFSTLAYIDNIDKVASYVKKYITKDMPIMAGKKRYWCSKGLIRPQLIQNIVITPDIKAQLLNPYKKNNINIYELPATLKAQIKEQSI